MQFPMVIEYMGVEIGIDLIDTLEPYKHPLEFRVTSPVSMISGIDTKKMLDETQRIIIKYFKLTKDYIDAYEHLAQRVEDHCLTYDMNEAHTVKAEILRVVVGSFIEKQVDRRIDERLEAFLKVHNVELHKPKKKV